ncbi:MAG TPA: endolytic transglycosylase MltG [Symbiobacteriaceae bacterium]|nr:endolytic transglycosylase MltG [Symbiobacteriaceae bacterium]
MRRWLASLLLLFVGASVGAGFWFQRGLKPVDPASKTPVTVEVPAGASTAQVAERLKAAGVIADPLIFRLWVRKEGKDGQIKSGEYQLTASLSAEEILAKLISGEVVIRRVILPEGLTIAEIAERVAASGMTTKEAFLQAAHQPMTVGDVAPVMGVKEPLEGYLFPAAYDWERSTTAEALVKRMTEQYAALWTPAWKAQAATLGLTVHQVTTLASIVQGEAGKVTEMPRIAGVYLNRLRDNWPLQADPTVYYALGKPKGEALLYKDLEIDSPYNTYKVPGLPPGPIAAPGKAALEAVLFAEKHPYFYFVAKADGSNEHFFAETLEQHNENVAKAEANATQKKP